MATQPFNSSLQQTFLGFHAGLYQRTGNPNSLLASKTFKKASNLNPNSSFQCRFRQRTRKPDSTKPKTAKKANVNPKSERDRLVQKLEQEQPTTWTSLPLKPEFESSFSDETRRKFKSISVQVSDAFPSTSGSKDSFGDLFEDVKEFSFDGNFNRIHPTLRDSNFAESNGKGRNYDGETDNSLHLKGKNSKIGGTSTELEQECTRFGDGETFRSLSGSIDGTHRNFAGAVHALDDSVLLELDDETKELTLEYEESESDSEDRSENWVSESNSEEEYAEEKPLFSMSGTFSNENLKSAHPNMTYSSHGEIEGSDFEDEDEELGLDYGEKFRVLEEDNEDGFEEKTKGVPAVMRCFDRAKIYVKAGDGGKGVVAFRREKYVPFGGPSGGDGGRGGNVYIEVDGSMNSLLPFRKNVHFRAGRGSHGQGKEQDGAKGEDVVVMVAPGTVVREAGTDGKMGRVLLELMYPGQRALLLPGGRGGRGNASFKSGTNKVPKIAENGEEGAEMWLDLELKLVADVGIVGAPNAGKSTLLSVISAAQPTIANYPFTTLLPNLGVVSLDYDATMVVADLPGLLEGAHLGYGLGHEFLRHSERCSVLVHVVDGMGQQPEYEFDAVRLELELFSPKLADKSYIVAFNKMDLPEASEKWASFEENLLSRGIRPFCMSAANRQGTHEVICAAHKLLKNASASETEYPGSQDALNLNHVAEMVNRQRSAPMQEFEIIHDSGSNSWHIVGAGLQRFLQMTNWQYSESLRRFQHVLEACGVSKALTKRGVKEGDAVIIGEMELVWHDSNGASHPTNMSRKLTGATKWPQWE
ncbi:GTP-binding protein OBGC, chloroplastic [Amborella trichopoda]|uniref:Obg family GTPase CgtA n=1 Tax=Amborella trichopoda TaxID=13333 RepID=U5D3D8_AMBTC|nr:GTP-binding protein OBGC, chloroplastic [Amborella trichopoda]XP_011627431.1 GTP-binding protein OBGC, chloroplastic [Amborella trichopoda]XP_020529800.1 GTP-binding protein OBGC, chloroplastic [Amborella trichopoda]ERN16939.1 hypothetical protein AMTR_s00057p00188930 [Amborella trichopoda]|eukprot:XP_006855472.1 GTP-binding protein OBGC, chloroplastic [Amborella trichopoda]